LKNREALILTVAGHDAPQREDAIIRNPTVE
jgi:hypothetical protein